MLMSHSKSFARVLLAGIILIFISTVASASIFSDENRYFVPAGDTINDDAYIGAQEGVIDGVIAQDLLIGARKFIVSGTVLGNVNAISQNATIRGDVGKSARVFAQNIIIDGHIENNLLGMGSDIELSNSSRVGKDVTLLGGEVSVSGQIGGDLIIRSGQVIISGKVDGDLDIRANKISIVSPAEIGGKIKYESRNKIKIDDDVIISGKVSWKRIEDTGDDDGPVNWALRMVLFFCALVTGLIILPLCKRHTSIASSQIIEKPLVCLGLGFVTMCIFPVAFLVLCLTIVGLPAAIILLFAFTVFFYISKVYVAIALGRLTVRAFRKGANPRTGWSLVLGLIILFLVFTIPSIGWILYFATIFFGIGAIILGLKKCRDLALSAVPLPPKNTTDDLIA